MSGASVEMENETGFKRIIKVNQSGQRKMRIGKMPSGGLAKLG